MTPEETFQACVKSILEHEGGLSLDKRDPGGVTQWGISLRYLKSIGYDINGDGKIDKEDIIGLPVKGAVGIYRKYWWDKLRYSGFNELITFIILRNIKKPTERLSQSAYLSQAVCALPSFNMAGKIYFSEFEPFVKGL